MKDIDTIKGRLKVFQKHTNLSNTEFAEKIGVSVVFLNKNPNSIRADLLIKIAKSFPELNILWLLGLGAGEMLDSSQGNELEILREKVKFLETKTIKQTGQIEILKELLEGKTNDNEKSV